MKRVSLVDMNDFAHHLYCLNCGLFVQIRSNRLERLWRCCSAGNKPEPCPGATASRRGAPQNLKYAPPPSCRARKLFYRPWPSRHFHHHRSHTKSEASSAALLLVTISLAEIY